MECSVKLIALILIAAFSVSAQKLANHGLVLTGSVVGLDTKCINGKPTPQIHLYMQFRNNGDIPLILNPPSWVFDKKIEFAGGVGSDPTRRLASASTFRFNPYLDNPFGSPKRDDYDPSPHFFKLLDSSAPNAKMIIEPGRYYEYQDVVWVKEGFKLDLEFGKSQKGCESTKVPVPEYPSFRLEYRLSDQRTGLFKTLQERWKEFGYLVLDDSGDIAYKSESILFDMNK
jgi:hypothetical protein